MKKRVKGTHMLLHMLTAVIVGYVVKMICYGAGHKDQVIRGVFTQRLIWKVIYAGCIIEIKKNVLFVVLNLIV